MFMIFLEVFATDTKGKSFTKTIYMSDWIWSRLYLWINWTKRKNRLQKKYKVWKGWRIPSYLFMVFFISSIYILSIIIPQYEYACDICYYPIMSFIVQHLFLFIIMLLNTQWSLVLLCCWCIWLSETIFRT